FRGPEGGAMVGHGEKMTRLKEQLIIALLACRTRGEAARQAAHLARTQPFEAAVAAFVREAPQMAKVRRLLGDCDKVRQKVAGAEAIARAARADRDAALAKGDDPQPAETILRQATIDLPMLGERLQALDRLLHDARRQALAALRSQLVTVHNAQ